MASYNQQTAGEITKKLYPTKYKALAKGLRTKKKDKKSNGK